MTIAGSPSIAADDYWWYRARADLLESVFAPYVAADGAVLDIGSADGPSVGWLRGERQHVSMDLDPRGLAPGGVCASALALPFADATFDVVAAFDVVEHCHPESLALAEAARVLRPGGHLLMAVPAYAWAWTHADDWNHHHRRYTRARAEAAVERAGLDVLRSTYAFAGTFPFFAAHRLLTRLKERGRPAPPLAAGAVPPLPGVSLTLDRFLHRMASLDAGPLAAGRDLPFGSSVLVAARRPGDR